MGKVFNKSKIHTKNAETSYWNEAIAKISGQKFLTQHKNIGMVHVSNKILIENLTSITIEWA